MGLISEIKKIKALDTKDETFLSRWFKSQIRPLDHSSIDCISHGYPIHFVIANEVVQVQLNNHYDMISEECDSRLILKPLQAIDTLVSVGVNRALFQILEALSWIGYEDEVKEDFIIKHNIIKSEVKVF
ncbi:hypothetical protein [Vibrio sp. 1180_3]|uniref:hypothetical protein n=1 Tax=Vibrio sp. 1180_3 TaxID=2528832 RepID=UPI002404E03C|nr:hypothetical protein [Vibrio sp. 1180_3]MDF9399071.1 hypothetical protein [Vibrio sp. 1180_3]